MKKIIILTSSLSSGGITSFLIPLVNLLRNMGNEVTLAYTKDNGSYINKIVPSVKCIRFNPPSRKRLIIACLLEGAFINMLKIKFRKKTEKPKYSATQQLNYIAAKNTNISLGQYDIAISSAEGFCNALVALKINASKKIAWIHPDVASLEINVKMSGFLLDKFDNVVTVSESGLDSLKKIFPRYKKKLLYIQNLLDSEYIISASKEKVTDMQCPIGYKVLVTVCRISNESKRIDRIVRIADILKKKSETFYWYIIGDGPDFKYIKSLIKKYKLENEVLLLGNKINPLPYIRKADCFILTSQYEGKPLVVEEAKILHKPVIVTEYSAARLQVLPETGFVVSNNNDEELEMEIADIISNNKYLSIKSNFKYDNSRSEQQIKMLINR